MTNVPKYSNLELRKNTYVYVDYYQVATFPKSVRILVEQKPGKDPEQVDSNVHISVSVCHMLLKTSASLYPQCQPALLLSRLISHLIKVVVTSSTQTAKPGNDLRFLLKHLHLLCLQCCSL